MHLQPPRQYIFLLSKNVSTLINLGLTMLVFFLFAALDGITFGWHFLMLIYPIACLIVLCVGVGLILSGMYVFFQDTQYLYDIFLTALSYMSAIFYTVDIMPVERQFAFFFNPMYCFIKYFRVIVLDGVIPSLGLHALCIGYAALFFALGALVYKKMNHKFAYYL